MSGPYRDGVDPSVKVLLWMAGCLVLAIALFVVARAAGIGETSTDVTTTVVPQVRADDIARQMAADFASPAYDAPDLAAEITGARREGEVLIFETTIQAGDRGAVGVCTVGQEHSEQVRVLGQAGETLASTHQKVSPNDGSLFYFCDLG